MERRASDFEDAGYMRASMAAARLAVRGSGRRVKYDIVLG